MNKHTILFLAANPAGADRLALDDKVRGFQRELERSHARGHLELVSRWAAEPLDLLRELRRLRPTIVHFSGHGRNRGFGEWSRHTRDIEPASFSGEPEGEVLFLVSADGFPRSSTEALAEVFGAVGDSVRVIVLDACYTDAQAEALLAHVDCVVGMACTVTDDAAKIFAAGFYAGLAEEQSVKTAFQMGVAAISLEGLSRKDYPRLAVRPGIDVSQLFPLAR